MEKELIIKKCNSCGAMVRILKDCKCDNCGIKCCNEEMQTLNSNSVDAAVEKHVPTYEVVNNELVIKVNHVMEEEHYIEWILAVNNNNEYMIKLKPGEEAIARIPFAHGTTIYSYCNKHGLWKADVE